MKLDCRSAGNQKRRILDREDARDRSRAFTLAPDQISRRATTSLNYSDVRNRAHYRFHQPCKFRSFSSDIHLDAFGHALQNLDQHGQGCYHGHANIDPKLLLQKIKRIVDRCKEQIGGTTVAAEL
jgi:hypothetical protein